MKRVLLLLTLGFVLVACAAPDETSNAPTEAPDLRGVTIDLHHSPGCSCCLGWVAYVEELGAEMTITEVADLTAFKTLNEVPLDATSCHTAIVDGYVVEGHVPAVAIQALLDSRPDLVGIALPGMPADSPGMGGNAWTWNAQPVVGIQSDGALTPFEY